MTDILALSAIRLDGGTQPRAAINDAIVEDYAADMRDGAVFPPVVVYHDGKDYWLADGFHRVRAAQRCKLSDIPADVRQGTRRDAVLFSVGANGDHGLRRSNADKRRAVETMLRDEEWRDWSDREIARQCGVSDRFVNGVRAELYPPTANRSQSNTLRRGGDGRVIDTGNIGKSRVGGISDDIPEATDPPSPDDNPVQAALVAGGVPVTRIVTHRDGTFTAGFDPLFDEALNASVAEQQAAQMLLLGWHILEARSGCVADNDQTVRPIIRFCPPNHPAANASAAEPADPANLTPRQHAALDQIFRKGYGSWVKNHFIQNTLRPEVPALIAAGLVELMGQPGQVDTVKSYRLTDAGRALIDPPKPHTNGAHAPAHEPLVVTFRNGVPSNGIVMPPTAVGTAFLPSADPDETADPDAPFVDEEETHSPDESVVPTARQHAVTILTSSATYEHYTPEPYCLAVHDVMGRVNLDPASCEIANRTVRADRYYTINDDGLKQTWRVSDRTSVYLNPPYGKIGNASIVAMWITRLIQAYTSGEIAQAILNVKASTAEQWFKPLWNYPICFVDHRISYDTPTGPSDGTLPGSSVFVYLGHMTERFIEVFTQFGPVVPQVLRAGAIAPAKRSYSPREVAAIRQIRRVPEYLRSPEDQARLAVFVEEYPDVL